MSQGPDHSLGRLLGPHGDTEPGVVRRLGGRAGQETQCEVARAAETQEKQITRQVNTQTPQSELGVGRACPRLLVGSSTPFPELGSNLLERNWLLPEIQQEAKPAGIPSPHPSLTLLDCALIFPSCPPRRENLDLRNQTQQLYLILHMLQLPGSGKSAVGRQDCLQMRFWHGGFSEQTRQNLSAVPHVPSHWCQIKPQPPKRPPV